MGGHKTQRKSSFSFFGIFKIKKSHIGGGNDTWDDSMKAYKVYPSDQDRAGRWADPRIDNKASVYIDTITNKWNHVEVHLSPKARARFDGAACTLSPTFYGIL
ncbi:uncharacterized protein LOC111898490 [Lactuca sativa]|uniref:uncharacterized protein LOC111898490 n=1 Tax=Lactuca sativa TaxID=4236 RepID=UPI000CD8B272|nr:uncharacterized protein LOC111898490 [Lactuca sativa]